jgi:hypothetical protein
MDCGARSLNRGACEHLVEFSRIRHSVRKALTFTWPRLFRSQIL